MIVIAFVFEWFPHNDDFIIDYHCCLGYDHVLQLCLCLRLWCSLSLRLLSWFVVVLCGCVALRMWL